MQRKIAYLVMAIITFSIGVTAVWLCDFASNQEVESSELNESLIFLASPPVKQRFTPTARGCGPSGWGQTYKTSDGEGLSESNWKFPSPALANRELQKEIKRAEKVVARAPSFDSKGKKIGERVVVEYPPDDNGIKWASIICTDKSFVYHIDAPSLQLALEFEKTKPTQ